MSLEPSGPEAELLDKAVLAKWDKVGKDLVARLIDAFLASAPVRLEACRFTGGEESLRAVETGAHTLKSSSGNLGARRLQAACASLEDAAERKSEAETAALAGELEGIFTRTLEALRLERKSR